MMLSSLLADWQPLAVEGATEIEITGVEHDSRRVEPGNAFVCIRGFRQDGHAFKLQGNATPPSGEDDRAQISVNVPLSFARALPESAVGLGIQGVMAAVMAASAGPSPSKPVPAGQAQHKP